jgi:hypothetical protein
MEMDMDTDMDTNIDMHFPKSRADFRVIPRSAYGSKSPGG